MRAVELERFGLDGLVEKDRPVPEPGPGEARVRMQAASLNYHDLAAILGMANPKMPLPMVPFSDGAGEVDAVGGGVESLRVGERVTTSFFPRWQSGPPALEKMQPVTGETAPGALQEYLVVPAQSLIPAPEHLDARQAATLPCAALTAWRAVVVEGRVKAGDRVLLQGTGGVSLFALQFAKMLGAEVIITSSSDEKLQRAMALGADHGINYREDKDWGRTARRIAGGEGVELVVEVGGAGTLAESLRAVRIGGHVSMIGVLTGVSSTVPTARIMAMNLTVRGITVGSREHFEAMNRAISLHRLEPVIGEVFSMADARRALETMQAGGHFGKICVEVSA